MVKPVFRSDLDVLQQKYEAAVAGLYANCRQVHGFDRPVLIEGGAYPGIWLECGPLESTVFALYEPDIALNSHDIFFKLQREDGYIPCTVLADRHLTGQIQMVVPLAATAYETALLTGNRDFLERAYQACGRWDRWLAAYRDTRGTGGCEAFCEWDTGHDNSPRFAGLPRDCPEQDARICPPGEGRLPYLAPDLSASVYGGRMALSRMAVLLGLQDEADQWERLAARTRQAIMDNCYDPASAAFYDVDADGRFVPLLGDVLTRVLGEQVVEQELFEEIFRRHLSNPREFWTPYPFPSVSVSDPLFDGRLPDNSWGGASQALTALRAPRWLEAYGKPAHLAHLMERWVSALAASPGFKQQMNPWTGEFSTTEHYSPSMCLMLDFIPRLYGIRLQGEEVVWNCRCPQGAARASYGLSTPGGWAELVTESGVSVLTLAGSRLLEVRGEARIYTTPGGEWLGAAGICMSAAAVRLTLPDGTSRSMLLKPNEVLRGMANLGRV
ncbi:MAG: hypothetical protein K0R57_4142 [Paenibacillaceae bacterium]|jgi:hypothetical protein|nr:hypothetical protein [Paenibacillaceae bacterium]